MEVQRLGEATVQVGQYRRNVTVLVNKDGNLVLKGIGSVNYNMQEEEIFFTPAEDHQVSNLTDTFNLFLEVILNNMENQRFSSKDTFTEEVRNFYRVHAEEDMEFNYFCLELLDYITNVIIELNKEQRSHIEKLSQWLCEIAKNQSTTPKS